MKIVTSKMLLKKITHWMRWGDEPVGYVSVGYYDKNGAWCLVGIIEGRYTDVYGLEYTSYA